MKAAVIDELGRVPQYREVPDPVVPDGWVLARVRAAAIKNIERMLVAGTHYGSGRMELPAQIGLDAVVELPDGRRAYAGATPPAGSMAQYLPVDPDRVFELPDHVGDSAVSALPNAAVSAWFALELAGRIQPGQSVLILGATGVTGGLAVQLAKHRFRAGHVVAVGRNADRLDRLRDAGADDVIRIGAGTPVGEAVGAVHAKHPIDLVVDHLWGEPAEATLRALTNDDLRAGFHRTRFVQVGETAGSTIKLPAAALRSAGVELVGQGAGSLPPEAYARIGSEILPALMAMLAAGIVTVDTVTRPLGEVATAWTEPVVSGVRSVLVP